MLVIDRLHDLITEHDVITGQQVGGDIKEGDVVEIYKEENDGNRLVHNKIRCTILSSICIVRAHSITEFP